MFSWGAMTTCLAAGRSFAAIATLRFFLGVFEAGMLACLLASSHVYRDQMAR